MQVLHIMDQVCCNMSFLTPFGPNQNNHEHKQDEGKHLQERQREVQLQTYTFLQKLWRQQPFVPQTVQYSYPSTHAYPCHVQIILM